MGNKDKRITGGFAGLAGLNLSTGEQDMEAVKRREEENARKELQAEKSRLESAQRQSDQRKQDRNRRPGGMYNKPREDKYVGAPYNFVPMWETVTELGERVKHNVYDDAYLSGEIRYSITANTPILVSDGNKDGEHFIRDIYGRESIPGSSLCGLIRGNAQILSQSSLADDIDDYELMYREVGGAKDSSMNKDKYNEILNPGTIQTPNGSVSVLKNVSAGYIGKEGGSYKFYSCKVKPGDLGREGMNYYVLSEKIVFQALKSNDKSFKERYEFFNTLPETAMQHTINGYDFYGFEEKGRKHYVCIKSGEQVKGKCRDQLNQKFIPSTHRISYELSNGRVWAVGKEGVYSQNGQLMISGKMQEKKVMYIIPEIDKDEVLFELDKNSNNIKSFEIDFNKRFSEKDKKSGIGKYYGLPEDSECKPVFYIDYNNRIYFGFTPNLRLFYDHTIHDGLGSGHKNNKFDYAKSLFGFSNDSDSYKSRVSFSDAVVIEPKEACSSVTKILGEPKPTSYADYLSLDKNGKSQTYNTEGFRIRGVKQYWLHAEGDISEIDKKNMNVASKMFPLPAGTQFEGVVRFQKLKRTELGLLLWSLRLENGSEMNIGKGKAYGFGRIKLDIKKVRVFEPEKAYNLSGLSMDPFKDLEKVEYDEMISEYKHELAEKLKVDNVMSLPAISAFIKMKDADHMPDPARIRYMNINNKEYQNRRPLQTVDEVLKK